MKTARLLFAAPLVLLAAIPAHAAVPIPRPPKPPAEGAADPDRDAWRGQAIGSCVATMREPEGVTPDELEATCGCAVDRLMAGRRTDALPALAPDGLGAQISGPLLACASDQRPAVAAALARRLAEPPPATLPTAESKPAETPGPDQAEAPKRSGPDFRSWLDGLSLPSWLTDSGMPLWAWVPLVLLAFILLRGLLRRGDRRDLIGPPPHMRLGARANPPAPRRADPPQRG